jgi:hypothetical protein
MLVDAGLTLVAWWLLRPGPPRRIGTLVLLALVTLPVAFLLLAAFSALAGRPGSDHVLLGCVSAPRL